MTQATGEVSPRGGIKWGSLLGKLGPLIGVIFVFSLFSILRPRLFLQPDNIKGMLLDTVIVGIASLGMTLIIISGGIDLSIGSNIALCTVTIGLLLQHHASTMAALVGGVVVSACCGVLIGSLITKLKLPPFIVTLATWGALRGLAQKLADSGTVIPPPETASHRLWLYPMVSMLTDKPLREFQFPIMGQILSGLPVSLDRTLTEKWMIVPPSVWLLFMLTVLMSLVLRYTRFGRHIYAIGSNENTARLCGVPVERTKILIYVVGLAFAGIAGVVQFARLYNEGDSTAAAGMELDIIAAVFIGGASITGGQGSVFGSVIGALIMTMVANGCTKMGMDNPDQLMITGGIIILAVVLDRLRHRKTD
jgi:ribose/xylose/arabinose/galactoside ABC-type transport system permease subunit